MMLNDELFCQECDITLFNLKINPFDFKFSIELTRIVLINVFLFKDNILIRFKFQIIIYYSI